MVCKNCGYIVSEADNFCRNCGAKLTENQENSSSLKSSKYIFAKELVQKNNLYNSKNNNNDQNNEKKYSSLDKILLVNSIVSLVVAFLIIPILINLTVYGSIFFSIILLFLDILYLVLLIKKYLTEKTRKKAWSIAVTSLSIIICLNYLFMGLGIDKYAKETISRVNKELGMDLIEVKPTSYKVNFTDLETLANFPYAINSFIYELDEENKFDMENIISLDYRFSKNCIDNLYEKLDQYLVDDLDVVVIYDLTNNIYNPPLEFTNSKFVIVCYDFDAGVLQILEVKGMN